MSMDKCAVESGTPAIASRFTPSERVVLHLGDCRSLLRDIPDDTIKLIITSPPYNLNKAYELKAAFDDYLNELKPIVDEMCRVLHPNGSICWQVGNYVDAGEVFPLDIYFYPFFKEQGLKLRNRIIWHFGHGLHAKKRFSGRYETLLWFTKSDDYTFNLDPVRVRAKYPGKRHFKGEKRGQLSSNPMGKNPSDIWEILLEEWEQGLWDIPNVKSNHPEKTVHPCQFPIELVERCVLALTDEDDWLLDPFAGVGSSLLAALRCGRRAIGCEKESEYVGIAAERVSAFYSGCLPYRPLGKPVHVPSGKDKVAQVPAEWLDRNGAIAADDSLNKGGGA